MIEDTYIVETKIIRLPWNKLWALLTFASVTIYHPVSTDIQNYWVKPSRCLATILSQLSVDNVEFTVTIENFHTLFLVNFQSRVPVVDPGLFMSKKFRKERVNFQGKI